MKKSETESRELNRLFDAALGKYVGKLEAEVLRAVWRLKEATTREVLADLRYLRRPAYTTVSTVLWRLSEKDLVRRSLVGRSYRYSPAGSQEEFLQNLSGRLLGSLLKDFGPVAVASFVEQMRTERPDQMRLLDQLLRGDARR